ncbi:hypothetical protein [Guptibacillus algicola]|nr:hypothetical protein [Alkalihalobacillus algicola]
MEGHGEQPLTPVQAIVTWVQPIANTTSYKFVTIDITIRMED